MREIPLYFYVPMFPGEDFLMGHIRKIQKKQEGKSVGKKKKRSQCYSKKQEGKSVGKKKKRLRCY